MPPNPRRRLLAMAVLAPTISTSLGVDGGAIFQIAGSENLGLSARALGIAFGMGVLSVPVQLLAARLPLWRARRNLQLYLSISAAMCLVLAGLVAAVDRGDRLNVAALAITVLAEINLSVLFATAWQPLLSFSLSTEERQRVNSRASGGSMAVRAAAAMLFGGLAATGRVAFYAAAAAVALWLAAGLRHVPAPTRPPPDETPPQRPGLPAGVKPLYVAIGLVAAGGTWPLFVTFVDKVLWPDINLGLVAAVQLGGSLLAATLWRTTSGSVRGRAQAASLGTLAAALLLAVIPGPVDGAVEQLAFFAATAGAAAATSTVFIALMESAHRVIDQHTSVRAMTILDVVASTSMQVGLLIAGLLIAAGDVYRVYLVLMAAAASASMRGLTE